jgi:hypothetical protein
MPAMAYKVRVGEVLSEVDGTHHAVLLRFFVLCPPGVPNLAGGRVPVSLSPTPRSRSRYCQG